MLFDDFEGHFSEDLEATRLYIATDEGDSTDLLDVLLQIAHTALPTVRLDQPHECRVSDFDTGLFHCRLFDSQWDEIVLQMARTHRTTCTPSDRS